MYFFKFNYNKMFKKIKNIIKKSLFKSNEVNSNSQFLPNNLNKKCAKIKVKIITNDEYEYSSDFSFECTKRLDQCGEAFFNLDEEEYCHEEAQIYICCISFNSTCFNELSAQYMEKFVVHKTSESQMMNYYFAKNINTGQIGYIPRYCLIQENQFFSDLIELKKNIYL